jgi:hypothetical protein
MSLPGDEQHPNTEVPIQRTRRQRRVVSKGVFVRTIGKKLGLFSLSGVMLATGLVLTLCTVVSLYFGITVVVISFGVLTLVAFWYSTRAFVLAKKVEAVRPVTNRTTHLLPPEESLVRASEVPTAHQPTELLRAVQSHHETPAEELLRATDANVPDV